MLKWNVRLVDKCYHLYSTLSALYYTIVFYSNTSLHSGSFAEYTTDDFVDKDIN